MADFVIHFLGVLFVGGYFLEEFIITFLLSGHIFFQIRFFIF
jgi:hypothetical protein